MDAVTMPSACTDSRRRPAFDAGLILLMLFPAGLLVLDRNSFVAPIGGIDSWVYAGFQWNLPDMLRTFGDTYYSTRLSAILPGWLAHQVLPALWAQYAVHIGVYLAGVAALYLTLRDVAGRRAAFLAAMCMACSPYYLSSTSWDYVDGFGIAYFLLAIYCLTRAASGQRWRLWLAASGGLAAAVVVANNTYLPCLPLLAVWFVVINRERNRLSWLASTMYAGLGAMGLLVALGVFSAALGGNLWFLQPSLTRVWRYNEDPTNPGWLGYGNWMLFKPSLLWPAVGTATAGIALVFGLCARKERRPTLSILALLALPVLHLGMFVVLDLRWNIGIVQAVHYVSMMLATTFLALGGQLKHVVEQSSPFAYRRICAFCGVFLVVLLLVPAQWSAGQLLGLESAAPGYLVLAVPALAAIVWLRVCSPGMQTTALTAAIVLLGLSQQQKLDSWSRPDMAFCPRLPTGDTSMGDRVDFYEAVRNAADQIWAQDRTANVWCWYNDETEPAARLFHCTASTQLYLYRILDRKFPALPEATSPSVRLIRQHGKVVVFSGSPDIAASALEALRERGLEGRVKSVHRIQHPLSFHMTFFEVTPASDQIAEVANDE